MNCKMSFFKELSHHHLRVSDHSIAKWLRQFGDQRDSWRSQRRDLTKNVDLMWLVAHTFDLKGFDGFEIIRDGLNSLG